MSTERDPNGLSANQPGAKLDAGKPDVTLLASFGRALREVARVGDYGQQKYSRNGWLSVTDGIRRYTRAMIDHWLREESEGTYDQDPHPLMQTEQWRNKIRHDAQVAWNALARLELRLREAEAQGQIVQGQIVQGQIVQGQIVQGQGITERALTSGGIIGGGFRKDGPPVDAALDLPGPRYRAMTSTGAYVKEDGELTAYSDRARIFASPDAAGQALILRGYTGRAVPVPGEKPA